MVIGMFAPGMVKGHIQNHGNAAAVTGIDKGFEFVGRAIDLGGRKVKDGI